MATWPVRVDGKSVRLKGAPALGQHNDEVLGRWLGLGAAEIAALRNESVI
jgi:crotonobetainyl-CoA:carnitine CoA-transferase CaiB-like acyl-CoA transferase